MSRKRGSGIAKNAANTTILIIDDNDDCNQLIKFVLEQDTDWKIVTTSTPEKVVILAQQHRPEVILLDVAMPKLNGFDLYRLFRSDPTTSNIPIIFMTAMPGMKQKIERQIVEDLKVIIKPFSITQLAAEIADVRDRYYDNQ